MENNERETIAKELEHVLKEIAEKGYNEMTYEKESKIEVSGLFFSRLISSYNHQRQVLSAYEQLYEATSNALDYNDQVTLDLTRKHFENCESGIAKKQEKK